MSRGTTFGYCKEHSDYCGNSCPFCQINKLKEQLLLYGKRLNRIRKREDNTLEVLRELWKRFYTHVDLGHKDLVMMGRDYIEKLDIDKKECYNCINDTGSYEESCDDCNNHNKFKPREGEKT